MSVCNYKLEDKVAHLTLNDGKVNVMSVRMLKEIDEALDRAQSEAEMVLFRSAAPGIFSAGFDLKVLASQDLDHSMNMMRAGAELALRLLAYPLPTLGVMAGHAFPMGAFLLLACDLRIGVRGDFRIGLNEVAIGITPPRFAIELARSRLHPAWLSRMITLGEMYEPDLALAAGFLDIIVPPDELDDTVALQTERMLGQIDLPSHAAAKCRLRAPTIKAMRQAIDDDLTIEKLAGTG